MKAQQLYDKIGKLLKLSPDAEIAINAPEGDSSILDPVSTKLEVVLDENDNPNGIITVQTNKVG